MQVQSKRAFVACVICTITLAGCGDSRSTITEEMITKLEEFNTVLAGVSDVESAKAVQPQLEAIGKDLQSLKKRADALPPPTSAEQKELLEKYQPRLVALMQKLIGTSMKLALKPGVADELKEPMQSLQKLNE